MTLPKYKFAYDIAAYIEDKGVGNPWNPAIVLACKIINDVNSCDLVLAKRIIDLFDAKQNLYSNIEEITHQRINIIEFVALASRLDPMICKVINKVGLYDIVQHNYELSVLPKEIIEAIAMHVSVNNTTKAFITASNTYRNYVNEATPDKQRDHVVSIIVKYFNEMYNRTFYKELPEFVNWAMTTKCDITAENFYWKSNVDSIHAKRINHDYENILEKFDDDPITAIIKLGKRIS
jgi:hypothetical protein